MIISFPHRWKKNKKNKKQHKRCMHALLHTTHDDNMAFPLTYWSMKHYYMSSLSGSIFGALVLYLWHTVQITPPTGPTSLCVFANRIVWNWTWTWTCLVLNCAERFYKVSSGLGVWKKWHWEKVCTRGPVVEEICFSFFSHFLSISVDVGKCCDPENRCMWLHRQGLKPRRLLWPKKLPQKKHEFSFIRQQTVCVWCRSLPSSCCFF